jgi:hypothetical protein
MILADQLNTLISYRAPELTKMCKENGYTGPAFSSCRFLGITNGGEVCYMAVFLVKGGTDSTKVFVNPKGHKVIAQVDKREEWSYN